MIVWIVVFHVNHLCWYTQSLHLLGQLLCKALNKRRAKDDVC